MIRCQLVGYWRLWPLGASDNLPPLESKVHHPSSVGRLVLARLLQLGWVGVRVTNFCFEIFECGYDRSG